jgi:hypothetical protein
MEDNIDRIQARVNQQYVIEQVMNHGEQLRIVAEELKVFSEVVVDYNTLLHHQAALNRLLIQILDGQHFLSAEEQDELTRLDKTFNVLVEKCLFEVEVF